jgi:D-alanyl-D-alanine carboxypeptidase
MNRRLTAIAAWCPAIAFVALVVVLRAGPVSPASDNPVVQQSLVPALAADASVTGKIQPAAFGKDEIASAVAEAAPEVTGVVSAPVQEVVNAPAQEQKQEQETVVRLAMADPTEKVEASPEQAKEITAEDQGAGRASGGIDSVEVLDECFVVETCMDRYLWALYQRTPKEDTVAEQERREVTVKKRGKLVTVTRTVTTSVNEEFSWKDRKAAEHVGMPLMDYVIGGVDVPFKRRLFNMLFAAEKAGLSPGITSAFRDDYRQSIASGLKAANDRSYHGGSSHGGYGHGLAADIVSVKGDTRAQRRVSTEEFWKWVDAHGPEFGIGRPYLGRDPPHVGPIDGKEYADHRGTKGQDTSRVASRAHGGATARHHATAKGTRTARS